MSWWHPYIGIPFVDGGFDAEGLDCRGLVRLVWREVVGRDDFPAYGLIAAHDLAAAATAIDSEVASGTWREVEEGEEVAFDVAVISRIGRAGGRLLWGSFHIGIVTDPGHILHCDEATGTVRLGFRDGPASSRHPSWGRSPISCYRHRSMA